MKVKILLTKKFNCRKINYKLILNELIKFTKKQKSICFSKWRCSITFPIIQKINKSKIKVSFTGEGADEIFGGYERYIKQNYLLQNKNLISANI